MSVKRIVEEYTLTKEEYYDFFGKDTIVFQPNPYMRNERFISYFYYYPEEDILKVVIKYVGKSMELIHTFYSNTPISDKSLQESDLYYINKFKETIRKVK